MTDDPRARRLDALALAVITLVSALPYVSTLGFYSDDWGLIAGFEAVQRKGHLAAFVAGDFIGRPVQGFYLAGLFSAFGRNPVGYHLVNAAVIAGAVSLFYLLLARLGLGRALAFATALLFAMLPQLTTVRVWYAAFQIPLSLALALASMHCQLDFARSGRWRWLAGAAVAALLSIAGYEIFAPLIAGFGLWLACERSRSSRRSILLGSGVVATVAFGLAYKLAFSGRTGPVDSASRYLAGLRQLLRLDYDWRVDSGLNILATPEAHFLGPIEGLWRGVQAVPAWPVIMAAIAVAGISWWRLGGIAEGSKPSTRLLLLGVGAFLLGNAVFLIVPAVVFTSTGMGNRVHVAAALGVAMIFTALIAFAAGRRPSVFAGVVVMVATLAFIRLAQVERFWGEASDLQRRVLANARSDLRDVPAGATIILDGVCPYHGPAVVFESGLDVGGALTLALGRAITGDAVSERMSATAAGLASSIYKEPSFYPYGPSLYLYDVRSRRSVQLTNAGVARRYFAGRTAPTCPRGYVARGVDV